MQIVKPIDIEDALRIDLSELMPSLTCCAPPAPDNLKPGTLCVEYVGGAQQTAVSSEYDVSVDVWAKTYDQAIEWANTASGYIAALPILTPASGRHYVTAQCMPAYSNPDPKRPTIPRATFRATVSLRGSALKF